jgi:hypothetical protein
MSLQRAMKNCGYCGRENVEEAGACCGCGTKFEDEADLEARDHHLKFGRKLCFLSTLNLRRTAFLWAGLHLLISLVLGAFCFYVGFGEALSDSYQPDPPILKIAGTILVILQASAIAAHWLFAKAGLMQATWEPHTAIVFAISWDVLLGLILWMVGRRIEHVNRG